MGLLDSIKDMISGASDHVQKVTDTVDGIANHEVIQSIKDSATELGSKAEEVTGGLSEQAQGVVDGLKDKVNK